jgi:hypothetical protein
MIVKVTGAEENEGRPLICRAVTIRCGPIALTHSGQRWPTAASIEQATQIGRLHSVQDNPVGRSGCR